MEDVQVVAYILTVFAVISFIAYAVIHIIIEATFYLIKKITHIFKEK